MQNKYPAGQVGLLLLVIMGVVIALVMSIASRSLSDTVLSRQERESSAAFALAETGIENAMNSLRQDVVPGLTQFADSSGVITGSFAVTPSATYGLFVKEGETAHLDLTGYVGTLSISWTKTVDSSENPGGCSEGSGTAPAALEIKALNTNANPSTVSYTYYNGYGCHLGGTNSFNDTTLAGSNPYLSSVSYVVPVGTTILRVKPIYNGATIGISGNPVLGNQLYLIQSKAVGGDSQKEIQVKRGLDAPASVFDFAVFTAGTIVK